MAASAEMEVQVDDEYDEDADSDFDAGNLNDENISTSSEEEADGAGGKPPKKRRKVGQPPNSEPLIESLDSGDEATIKEHRKSRRKQKHREEVTGEESDEDEQSWRAKTRAMREREKEDKKKTKLASSKGSVVDVDKLWMEMNQQGQPKSTTVTLLEKESSTSLNSSLPQPGSAVNISMNGLSDQENRPVGVMEEMIVIKRTYKFAGEVHTEEKSVPKSSAEARLWLSQQGSKDQVAASDGQIVRRPLRKISRFDPNFNNLEAFKTNWASGIQSDGKFKGKKINTVEKSKLDWVAHVDAEGYKEELDEHAKSKQGYHNRKDFLDQVERRREDEAREARTKG